jgi:hypothetical protein
MVRALFQADFEERKTGRQAEQQEHGSRRSIVACRVAG